MRLLLVSIILMISSPALGITLSGVTLYGVSDGASSSGVGAWADTFGPCTAGTDCFCDLIDTTGTVNGAYSNVFFCADFDHDAFYATSPSDVNDSYGNNNWVSTSGAVFGSGDRGGGSRWAKLYGGTWAGMTWQDGEPTTTCGSVITSVGDSGIGSGPLEWDASDRWCANAYSPRIDIIGVSTDFSAENSSTVPTIPGSGGESIFGDQLLGMRVEQFEEQGFLTDSGSSGAGTAFGGAKSQLGVTVALNYESNIVASGILDNPWKHDEFDGPNGTSADGLFLFKQLGSGGAPSNTFPLQGFIFPVSGFTCSGAISGATQTLGTFQCDAGGNIIYYAEQGTGTNQYEWPTDFDLTEFHCVSAHWNFTTISSVSVKFWFDGELVIDVTGLDFTNSPYDGASADGVDSFELNTYSNKVYDGGGLNTTSTRRYIDNYVMRNGSPVLCEDIGFPASYNQEGL